MKIIGAIAIITILGIAASIGIGVTRAQSSCIDALTGASSGTWSSDCISQNTPTEPANLPSGTRYARYYSFTLISPSDVTIELASTEDTYLYLMEEIGTNGNVVHENDDAESGNTNSRIAANLQSGDYTIEASTYNLTTTGAFTLTITGLPDVRTPTFAPSSTPTSAAVPPTPTPTPESGDALPTPTVTPSPIAALPTPTPEMASSALVAGPNHSCSLNAQGQINCLGLDRNGQVTEHPQSSGFKALAIGAHHSCALDQSGQIRCWGSDEHGQSSPPTQSGFTALQSGDEYTCALDSDGYMRCWGKTYECNDFSPNADLRNCNLADRDLSGVDLRSANLSNANLAGTNLGGANLSNAQLVLADLSDSDMSAANFSGANLFGAILSDAILRNANFSGAELRAADLTVPEQT